MKTQAATSYPVKDLEQLALIIKESPQEDHLKTMALFSGHQCVYLNELNWSTLWNLESQQMINTAHYIIGLAQQQFFQRLQERFVTPQQLAMLSTPKVVHLSCKAAGVKWIDLEKLRQLSDRMVERIADLYNLHTEDVSHHAESLTLSNLDQFMQRVHAESRCVNAIYLGTSKLQNEFLELIKGEPVPQKTVDFLNRLASEGFYVHCPLSKDPTATDYSETMSMELLTTSLIYQLPLVSKSKAKKMHFNLFIQGYGVVTYRMVSSLDLWSGLIAYRFTPDLENLSSEAASLFIANPPPDIFSVRGTQRKRELPGFLGSMISIWHPQGPGANVMKGKKIEELEALIVSSSCDWILSGHSMGAEIATALAKRPKLEGKAMRVYSFSNPGRNKYHTLPEQPMKNVHHFVSLLDPVAQLGTSRDGRVTLVSNSSKGKPQNMFEMVNHVVDYIREHHSTPQFLGNSSWIAAEMPEGAPIAKYNPLWGFAHRLISQHLYGPWKMIALITRAALPIINRLALWSCEKARLMWSEVASYLVARQMGTVKVVDPSTTRKRELESLVVYPLPA